MVIRLKTNRSYKLPAQILEALGLYTYIFNPSLVLLDNHKYLAIRAYDPCLSCATHAMGQMPFELQLFDHRGDLIQEKIRN